MLADFLDFPKVQEKSGNGKSIVEIKFFQSIHSASSVPRLEEIISEVFPVHMGIFSSFFGSL